MRYTIKIVVETNGSVEDIISDLASEASCMDGVKYLGATYIKEKI